MQYVILGLLFISLAGLANVGPDPSTGPGIPPGRAFLVGSEDAERSVLSGRAALLHMSIDEAERIFDALSRRPDARIAAFHHLATASMLKVLIADEQADYADFFARSESFQAALHGAPGGAWHSFLDAEHHLQRMAVHAKQGNFIRAALAARRAYARSEEAVRQDPAFYDAYKGLGLLHLAIGSVPGTYRRILQVIGYKGEVQQGLRELRLAAERGRYSRDEAAMVLGLAEGLLLDRPDQAVATMRAVYDRTDQSTLVGFAYGFLLLKARRAAEAESVLRTVAARDESEGYFYTDYTDHFLAEALFKRGRFAESERFYRRYLDRHEGPSLRPLSNLEIGRGLEMQGKRGQALAYYRQVKSDRSYDTDQAAVREAHRRLVAPMSPAERQLLLASNAFGSGDYARTEALLRPLTQSSAATQDERAEAFYRLGRVAQVQEQWAEALKAYGQAIALTEDPLARWEAWSHFYIGRIHAAQGRKEVARRSYQAALAVRGRYDYYQTLEGSVKAALERLKS